MSKVSLEGVNELTATLFNLQGIAGQKTLAQVARKAMKPVLDDAKRYCPVRTGALRKSIKIATVKPGSGNVVASAGLVAMWRWRFIEKGTSKMSAKPFLRPAMMGNRDNALQIVRDELGAAVKKAAKEKALATAGSEAARPGDRF